MKQKAKIVYRKILWAVKWGVKEVWKVIRIALKGVCWMAKQIGEGIKAVREGIGKFFPKGKDTNEKQPDTTKKQKNCEKKQRRPENLAKWSMPLEKLLETRWDEALNKNLAFEFPRENEEKNAISELENQMTVAYEAWENVIEHRKKYELAQRVEAGYWADGEIKTYLDYMLKYLDEIQSDSEETVDWKAAMKYVYLGYMQTISSNVKKIQNYPKLCDSTENMENAEEKKRWFIEEQCSSVTFLTDFSNAYKAMEKLKDRNQAYMEKGEELPQWYDVEKGRLSGYVQDMLYPAMGKADQIRAAIDKMKKIQGLQEKNLEKMQTTIANAEKVKKAIVEWLTPEEMERINPQTEDTTIDWEKEGKALIARIRQIKKIAENTENTEMHNN